MIRKALVKYQIATINVCRSRPMRAPATTSVITHSPSQFNHWGGVCISGFDRVIRKRRFVSFFDPRDYATRAIIDLDQVDAVDTKLFAFNDDLDDTNDMIDLLRRTVERQTSGQLSYFAQRAAISFPSDRDQ